MLKDSKKALNSKMYAKIVNHPVKNDMPVSKQKSDRHNLIRLVDDIDEHLGKSMALGALLTLDNVFSIDKNLLEHFFWQIKDELWHIKQAWLQLNDKI